LNRYQLHQSGTIIKNSDSYFKRTQRGEIPVTPIASLLGRKIEHVDIEAGTLTVSFQGADTFANPAGNVAGGMLGAMLDDLTALMVAATLEPPDEGVVTISLNVSFLRPAVSGPITGLATLVRRGRELCHVNGMLQQDGKDIAWAVAICKVVRG